MTDLSEVLDSVTPVRGYDTADDMKRDVERLIDAENPVSDEVDRATSVVERFGEPDLLAINDLGDVTDDDLERAIDEWDGMRAEMSNMYRTRAEYFEWECRRARLLESIATVAEIQFGHASADRTERHRIVIEVKTWAAYAKHILMEVEVGDVATAEDVHGFLDIGTKHGVNDAIMTSASVFESVGREVLIRNHDHPRGDHFSMSDINDKLRSEGYVTETEHALVDGFRKDIRNSIAHDIFQRSRFDEFNDFRGEVIRPCWEIIDVSEGLAEREIAPEGGEF